MRSMAERTEIFERLPVKTAVWKQIIPAVASQMITLVYNLADTYFVGMLNDPRQTAAVTVAGASFLMLTALSNLFGVGGASLIAGFLGKKEPRKASQVAAITFWCGLVFGVLFSLGYVALARPVLHLCGATEDTYAFAYGYVRWTVIFGGTATILNTLLANLIRAEGAAGAASLGLSLGGVLNIILDPIFVLPQFLGYGAVGAGIATMISNFVSLGILLLYVLRQRKDTVISLRPGHLRFAPQHLPRILSVGFPSAVQYALTLVASSAQLNFVSKYETEAIAGLGIVKKLDQLPLYFSIGVANGLLPLLAYNHSAGNHRRRRDTFRFGSMISLSFSLLCFVCYELFAPFLVGLFIDNPLTRAYGADFLRLMVCAMPFMSLCYPMIIQFQAIGRVKESLICSILRKGAVDIPLLFLLDRMLPLYGCMMVQPIVDAMSLVIALFFYRRINRSLNMGQTSE